MFKQDFHDAELKKGEHGLLGKALEMLRRFTTVNIKKEIRDDNGLIGYEIRYHYLVAKKEPYGNVVSVSEEVWDSAIKNEKRILMYIDESGYFYEFIPWEVEEFYTNKRGDTFMINFDIRNGRNFMDVLAQLGDVNSKVEKNEKKLEEFSKKYL